MRSLFSGIAFTLLTLVFAGCAASSGSSSSSASNSQASSTKSAAPTEQLTEQGVKLGVYYAKVGFWFEKNKNYSTNYAKGTFVSAGSKVQIVATDSNEIELTVPGLGDAKVRMENVEKYTQLNVKGLVERTFSATPVKISGSHAEAIKSGNVIVGMTKNEVIMARGYPPVHETPTLKMDEWHYWKHRFGRTFIYFKNDKVTSIKG